MTRSLAEVLEDRERPLIRGAIDRRTVAISKLVSYEEPIRRMLILIALYAIPAVMVMRPVTDPDIWWHLRTGQWIVEHGAVPTTDPFSSFGLGKPWVAYSWLFELLVYGLYRGLGLCGIILYRVVLTLAVALSVHRLVAKREPRFAVAIGLVGAALFAFLPLMNERSWLFTILFYTLTLDVVLDLRAGRSTRAAWLLPPLYALWANVHIQFVYGLFLLALACAAPVADRLFGRSRPGGSAATAGTRGWWGLVALCGACIAATLLNPYHGRLYAVIVEYATQPAAYRLVSEHTALGFRAPCDWAVPALAGAAAFALGRRAGPSTFEVLLLVISAYVSFHSKRDIWFVVLAALALLATARRPLEAVVDRFAVTWPRAFLVAGAVGLVLLVTGWSRGLSEEHLEQEVATEYPVRAAAVVAERGYAGPLYNHFNWGGYLIWRLPGLPVAIDNRMNVHGDERIQRNIETTWVGSRGWDSDPELKAAGLVIADAKAALTSLLRLHPRFELVYEDTIAAVFVARPMPKGH